MSPRASRFRVTMLGREARCSKCGDFWPADAEFYFMQTDGRPHSWCKACYIADRRAKGTRGGTGRGTVHHDVVRDIGRPAESRESPEGSGLDRGRARHEPLTKKRAGRLLDGQLHDGYPVTAPAEV